MRAVVRSPLLVLVALLAGCAAPSSEEAVAEDQDVVGGRVTNTAHPAVGYLAVASEPEPFCTATLVASTYVVTAAHCIDGVESTSLVFGTGAFDRDERRTAIKRCLANSKYDATSDPSLIYDFAFCELAAAPRGIEPLAFVSSPALGARYLAIGYGQTKANDADSAGPRKQLTLRRVDPDEEPMLEGLEGMLAAKSTRGDTCFGDSGGPLLVVGSNGVARIAGVLHGGISEDDTDCHGGNIGVYAPVAKNLSFYASR